MENKFTPEIMRAKDSIYKSIKRIMKELDTNPKVKEYIDQMIALPIEPQDPLPLKKPTLSEQPVELKKPVKPKKA